MNESYHVNFAYEKCTELRDAIDDIYNEAEEEIQSHKSQLQEEEAQDKEGLHARIEELEGIKSRLGEAYRFLDCVERHLP